MTKLKVVLAVVLAGGFIVGGTALLGRRALGLYQHAPGEAKSPAETPTGTQGKQNPPAEPSPAVLNPNAKARIEIATKLRDTVHRLFEEGETDQATYLAAQTRYDEVLAAVTVKSDADRVRNGELRVVELKQIEQRIRDQIAKGERSHYEVLTVELDRLEAEDDLAKAKARLSAVADTSKERLRVAKRVRDAMYKRFSGGQMGVEEYLVWQKRYDDVASVVMLATGGDRIRLYESQVAELKEIEQRVRTLYDDGQVQESDVDIVRYYRLQAEEALAIAKAENGESPRKVMNNK
jgi:hypothetical protein